MDLDNGQVKRISDVESEFEKLLKKQTLRVSTEEEIAKKKKANFLKAKAIKNRNKASSKVIDDDISEIKKSLIKLKPKSSKKSIASQYAIDGKGNDTKDEKITIRLKRSKKVLKTNKDSFNYGKLTELISDDNAEVNSSTHIFIQKELSKLKVDLEQPYIKRSKIRTRARKVEQDELKALLNAIENRQVSLSEEISNVTDEVGDNINKFKELLNETVKGLLEKINPVTMLKTTYKVAKKLGRKAIDKTKSKLKQGVNFIGNKSKQVLRKTKRVAKKVYNKIVPEHLKENIKKAYDKTKDVVDENVDKLKARGRVTKAKIRRGADKVVGGVRNVNKKVRDGLDTYEDSALYRKVVTKSKREELEKKDTELVESKKKKKPALKKKIHRGMKENMNQGMSSKQARVHFKRVRTEDKRLLELKKNPNSTKKQVAQLTKQINRLEKTIISAIVSSQPKPQQASTPQKVSTSSNVAMSSKASGRRK